MNKRLNLIINGKGGVGKSFFACNFITYLRDRCIPHVAIDTDHENSTLKRFHPQSEYIDIEQPHEIDDIFGFLQQHDLLVVDCRAASTDLFLGYFAEVKIFEYLKSAQTTLTVIVPVNHEADSVEQVRVLTDELNGRCQYLVVRNEAHSEQFQIYERNPSRQRLLHELHGREITMPRMYDWLVATLNIHDLTTTAALSHPEVMFFDRQRIRNWQQEFYEQLDQATDLLVPETYCIAQKTASNVQPSTVKVS